MKIHFSRLNDSFLYRIVDLPQAFRLPIDVFSRTYLTFDLCQEIIHSNRREGKLTAILLLSVCLDQQNEIERRSPDPGQT